jgi:hypothetical protein
MKTKHCMLCHYQEKHTPNLGLLLHLSPPIPKHRNWVLASQSTKRNQILGVCFIISDEKPKALTICITTTTCPGKEALYHYC